MRTRPSRRTSSCATSRQRGDETFFLTGVDEHASKVARVAEEQGLEPAGVRRPDRRAPGGSCPGGSNADQRLLHPHDATRATSASFRTSCSASTTTATSTRTSTRASTASAARSSRTRTSSSTASAPIHDVEPEWIEEKNYFFRLSAYQDRLLALYDERPDFVLPGFRYNEARSFIAGRPAGLHVSRAGQPWGIPLPWDREPGHLRLGRRAHQLPERAHVRARGRGSASTAVLAGRAPPAREGHPSLPLRLLAGDAARRRATTFRSSSSCTAT